MFMFKKIKNIDLLKKYNIKDENMKYKNIKEKNIEDEKIEDYKLNELVKLITHLLVRSIYINKDLDFYDSLYYNEKKTYLKKLVFYNDKITKELVCFLKNENIESNFLLYLNHVINENFLIISIFSYDLLYYLKNGKNTKNKNIKIYEELTNEEIKNFKMEILTLNEYNEDIENIDDIDDIDDIITDYNVIQNINCIQSMINN